MSTTPCNLSTEVNECHSNPCQYGGTCTDQIGGYHCTCLAGFTGTECQTGEFYVGHSSNHSTITVLPHSRDIKMLNALNWSDAFLGKRFRQKCIIFQMLTSVPAFPL